MPSDRAKGPTFSFRTIVIAIALAGILPTLAFSGLLMLQYAQSERARSERGLIESAKGIARAIDGQFITAEAMLLAMRDSEFLQTGNLGAFEVQLRRTSEETGQNFTLTAPDGQQLINTFFRKGEPLPPTDRKLWAKVFTERHTVMTDMFTGSDGDRLLAGVGVPVIQNGKVRWVLVSALSAHDFAPLLEEPGVPADWIVAIVDRTGRHIVRSHSNEQFAGKPLTPDLIAQMRAKGTGTLRTTSPEGIPLISTVQYARRSEWAAAVGLPVSALETPMRQSLRDLVIIGTIVAVAALALAFLVAQLLDRAMSALTQAAARVGRREVIDKPNSMVTEVNTVGRVLAETSRELNDLTASLETQVAARTAELSDANARLVDESRRREESEAQVMQMHKIEAVGQLTGGIAHDFNNMLAIVLSSLRLLQRRLEHGDTDVQKYIDGAVQGAERAASLTSRLLAFSRQQPLAPEVVDCNDLIASMDEILRRTIPESVRIETQLTDGLWRTYVDTQGLESAIINLAVNGRDAMPDGGRLTIETANCLLDEAYAALHLDVRAGQYVMVAVKDTGVGMPVDVISRAFDPFFTTKPAGIGTGLGLSQVHGFVRQSGGHVEIESEVGRGTAVKLYLPRLPASAEEAQVSRPELSDLPRAPNGETVLVVEDEPEVRRLATDILQELGYTTLAAENTTEALELLEEHPEIALLFTDVIMPHMNGRQLADEARRLRPDLPVLFTTGYTPRSAMADLGIVDSGMQIITKPYTLAALALKVSELLQSTLRP